MEEAGKEETVVTLVRQGIHYARCLERLKNSIEAAGVLKKSVDALAEIAPELAPELLAVFENLESIYGTLDSAANVVSVKFDLAISPPEERNPS